MWRGGLGCQIKPINRRIIGGQQPFLQGRVVLIRPARQAKLQAVAPAGGIFGMEMQQVDIGGKRPAWHTLPRPERAVDTRFKSRKPGAEKTLAGEMGQHTVGQQRGVFAKHPRAGCGVAITVQGGEGRTKMKLLRYSLWDYEAFGVGVLLIAAVCVLRSFGL